MRKGHAFRPEFKSIGPIGSMGPIRPINLHPGQVLEEKINAVKRLAVSTGKLSALLHLHIRPIDPVVFREPMYKVRETSSCGGFHAYMPSAFILAARGYPAMPLARQLAHQRCVLSNPLVLGEKPLTFPAPTTDRDRPVSRRSKPSSRTAFIGEQPNPWELLHPQDAMHVIPRFPVA